MNGEERLLVTEKSATSIGLKVLCDENNISFDTNHYGLVKYNGQYQLEYQIVKAKLSSFVATAPSIVRGRFRGGGA
jgi:flagellar basal body rod protein FlgB